MARLFLAKFFSTRERTTILDLGRERQGLSEDVGEYVRRFREKALECVEPIAEDALVGMCVAGMLDECRVFLENLGITTFARLTIAAKRTAASIGRVHRRETKGRKFPLVAASEAPKEEDRPRKRRKGDIPVPPAFPCSMDKVYALLEDWVKDNVIRLPKVDKPPTPEQMADPNFCRFHRHTRHHTSDCWALRRIFHQKLLDREIVLEDQRVEDVPYPQHRTNARALVVFHDGDPTPDYPQYPPHGEIFSDTTAIAERLVHNTNFKAFYDNLGFTPEARRVATGAIVDISAQMGEECFLNMGSLKYARPTLCFTEADMTEHPDHNRPLYLGAVINGIEIKRALVDTGAGINLMPRPVFDMLGIPTARLVKQAIEIRGFDNTAQQTEGHVMVDLAVGQLRAPTRFHVINSTCRYHVILGRPWIHYHGVVPSSFHQCIKAWRNGREVTIPAAKMQEEVRSIILTNDELIVKKAEGVPIEDQEGNPILSRKRKAEQRNCERVRLPDGRTAYRL